MVIDEAHTIPVENLESLVRLSHVKALTGEPLLQMLLVGLPILWRHSSTPPLRPCKPRRAARVTLAPLTYDESQTTSVIVCSRPGADDGTIFTPGAVRHVARHAAWESPCHEYADVRTPAAYWLCRRAKTHCCPHARDVITAYKPKDSNLRWWGVRAAASVLAVAAIVGLSSVTHQLVTEHSSGGFLPFMPSFLAGSGMETAQQPAKTVSLPLASTLSVLPTPNDTASPDTASTEMPTLSVQVAALPATSAFQTPAPMPLVTDHIPQAVQPSELPSSIDTAQSVALQALREVVMPSKPAPSPRALPIPLVTTAHITSPQNGAMVVRKIAVEGVIAKLQPDQHAFLCVQSRAFGRRIYPQGRVRPDPTGNG